MQIVCPYCQQLLKFKGAKPGRYSPKCSSCARVFQLTVPDDPTGTMAVTPMPAAAPAPAPRKPVPSKPASADNPDATAPLVSAPAADSLEATSDSLPPPADNPDATAALGPDATPLSEMEATTVGESEEPAKAAAKKKAKSTPKLDMPDKLGGFEIVKELGRGGMGAVYLARQLSLDRNVALKVMKPEWAKDPVFMARFTREAYVAAQLVHHNVVQIYDLGIDHDINFFSMEFVEGQSLGDLLKREKKLKPEAAVGHILQAARGLKFGHDRGMIHRDIKPDNLMLNNLGIVKVADLGLVKTPEMTAETDQPAGRPGSLAAVASSQVTMAGTGMGTPAYMAPEQARDATHVDARADIYSLGCTLYALVCGRPPFQGKTALEVLTKHAFEPVPPPEKLAKEVSKALSTIILKMVAKKPDERYRDLGELIQDLEGFLGTQGTGRPSLEQHAATLEGCVKAFQGGLAGQLRARVALAFFGGCAFLVLACIVLGMWVIASAFVGLAVLTPCAYFVVSGFLQKTYLFDKVREWLLGSNLVDWFTWLVGGLLFLGILYFLGLLWLWLAVCVIAVGLALALHFLIDRKLAAQRQPVIDKMEQLLRSLRLQGMEEDALREFVAKYSGEGWEELYEALFGYEAKMTARGRWGVGTGGRLRAKSGAWRDPLVAWIDGKQRGRREARERKHLQGVEQKKLQAEGLSAGEAKEKAEHVAEVMVHKAAEIKQQEAKRAKAPVSDSAATVPQEPLPNLMNVATLLQLPDSPEAAAAARKKRGSFAGGLFGLLFGGKMRFLVGALLLAGCALWMQQNDLVPGQATTGQTAEKLKEKDIKGALGVLSDWFTKETKPLAPPLAPAFVGEPVGRLFNSFNPGVAGLILILSALFRGFKMGLFVWPSAAIVFAGALLGIPSVGPLSASLLALAAGSALALFGFLFGRQKAE